MYLTISSPTHYMLVEKPVFDWIMDAPTDPKIDSIPRAVVDIGVKLYGNIQEYREEIEGYDIELVPNDDLFDIAYYSYGEGKGIKLHAAPHISFHTMTQVFAYLTENHMEIIQEARVYPEGT